MSYNFEEKNSERPVDALAENGKLPTHLLTTSNQEMPAHLIIMAYMSIRNYISAI